MTSQKIDQMQVYLANLHILYQKYRNYHWNIIDPQFVELHEFFEEQYNQISEHIDEVAERIRMLDVFPKSKIADYLQIATLTEDEIQTKKELMIQNLIGDTTTVITHTNAVIKLCEEDSDYGNADVFTAILQSFEKTGWMLKSMNV